MADDNSNEWNGGDRRAQTTAKEAVDPVYIATSFGEIAGQMRLIRRAIEGVRGEVLLINKAGYVTFQTLPGLVLQIPELKQLHEDALRGEGSRNVWRFVAGGGGFIGMIAFAFEMLHLAKVIP